MIKKQYFVELSFGRFFKNLVNIKNEGNGYAYLMFL